MGKKAKVKRETKGAESAAAAEVRARAERIAIARNLETRIREEAANDDPAFLRKFDQGVGPSWVAMILLGGSLPQLLMEARAGKCLAFFVETAAREAGPRMAQAHPNEKDQMIIDALSVGIYCLEGLSRRSKFHPAEHIREAIRGLHRHLPPKTVEDLKRSTSHPLVLEDFELVERELFAADESEAIWGAIGDGELAPSGRKPGIDD